MAHGCASGASPDTTTEVVFETGFSQSECPPAVGQGVSTKGACLPQAGMSQTDGALVCLWRRRFSNSPYPFQALRLLPSVIPSQTGCAPVTDVW
ncbi:MAG: hypothetical protein HY088_02300 [Ignavibacteriales bacterium]|nr:hypothetical protein [Ignavibacteriales bacterium]